MFIVKIGPCSSRDQDSSEILGSVFRRLFDGQVKQRLESGFLLEWPVDPVILRKSFRLVFVAGLGDFGQQRGQLLEVVVDDEVQRALLKMFLRSIIMLIKLCTKPHSWAFIFLIGKTVMLLLL